MLFFIQMMVEVVLAVIFSHYYCDIFPNKHAPPLCPFHSPIKCLYHPDLLLMRWL